MLKVPIEKTLVLLKPDALQRNLVGEIIKRLCDQKGFQIDNMKLWDPVPPEFVKRHYEQYASESFFEPNCNFMTSGPLISMIIKGENVISHVRKLQGNRDIPGTIRGDFVVDVRENLIHASDSKENALKEMNIWFPK